MDISDIKHDKHYAVRLGLWTLTGRVDAVDEVASKVFVWTEVGYRPVAASAILYECKSPEQYRAIIAKRRAESRMRTQAWRQAFDARPPRPTVWEHQEPIINRQGSVFTPGDYGITRE